MRGRGWETVSWYKTRTICLEGWSRHSKKVRSRSRLNENMGISARVSLIYLLFTQF